MQGRYLEHQALKSRGGTERISMVTSLRPRSALVRDESVLGGVRCISHEPTICSQYAEYRLENMEERIRDQLRQLRKSKAAGVDFDIAGARKWFVEQQAYMERTAAQLYDP